MLTHQPNIARTRNGCFANLWHRILVALACVVRLVACNQFGQRIGVETGDVKVEPFQIQCFQFNPQHRIVPPRVLGDAVVSNDQCAALRLSQVIKYDHRHDLQTELLGGSQAPVASNDDTVTACQDRIGKSELCNAGGDLCHLFI